jgi:hypothetical protein
MLKLISGMLAALTLALPAPAQPPSEDYSNDRPERPNAPVRAQIPGSGSGEVTLNVRSFGIGNTARPGGVIGVLVEVSDSSDKIRPVMVRLNNPDPDGDTALNQRVIVTNPGVSKLVWLYMRLPFAGNADTFDINAFEATAVGGVAEGEPQRYVPERMLGSYKYQINPRQIVPTGVGLVGVVGTRVAGLEQYRWVVDPTKGDPDHAITGHELTEIIQGVPLVGLPDRWHGYSELQALVWTSAAAEDSPLNMREQEQAAAIREYVKQGGHFIVVLPPVGQNWIAQPNNPLADIMPAVKVTRTEGVDLDKYRSLFTRDTGVSLPTDAVVQSFTPERVSAIGAGGTEGAPKPDWGGQDAIPIMVGPDGEVVVVRRLVGAGMVTVIGLDVVSVKLHLKSRWFEAQQFWNRILGKRLRIPTQAEIAAGIKGGKINGVEVDAYPLNGSPQRIDLGVGAAVNNEGSAATGLFLAFVVFLGYWLVAGPVGFFVLKQRNWKRHAWVAFVASTGVFTAIAWGGANVLKGRRVNGRHLTIVDGVYGQPSLRARSWMGLFLPRYGEQELSVAPPSGAGAEWKNLIFTWDPANVGGSSSWQSFPDARGYVVDVRSPDTAAFPSRATTKQVQVDWAGVLPANWTLPHPLAESSVPVGKEITLGKRSTPKSDELEWTLRGTLVHGLPAPLTNVHVIVVREPFESGTYDDPSSLRRKIAMGDVAGEWKAGEPLVLDTFFKNDADRTMTRAMQALVPQRSLQDFGEKDYGAERFSLAVSFMDLAEPPTPTPRSDSRWYLQRTSTHGLDLSRWTTQPCLIVIGELGADREGAECPIPVRVDTLSGDDVRARVKGRTIVRWIYPLDPAPFKTYTLPAPKPKASDPTAPGGGQDGGGEAP